MHNKIYAVICTALVLVSLTISAFAAPGEGEPTSEPEIASMELVEGEESTSEELETVNISEESVQAIAEAVSDDGFEMIEYTLNDGTVVTVPAPPSSEYSYYYVYLNTNTGLCDAIYSTAPCVGFYSSSNGGRFPLTVESGGSLVYYSIPVSVWVEYEGNSDGTKYPTYIWFSYPYCSNYDVVFSNTSSVDPIPANPSEVIITISFETGFDDLTVESQLLTELDPPILSYPGYTHVGWYLDPDFETPYTAAHEFTSNATLYAKWEETGAMAFFTNSLLSSFSTALNVEPILYVVSLMALLLIIGILRKFVFVRI